MPSPLSVTQRGQKINTWDVEKERSQRIKKIV
jgi:hypothetical protein